MFKHIYVNKAHEAAQAVRGLLHYSSDAAEAESIPVGFKGHTHIPLWYTTWLDPNLMDSRDSTFEVYGSEELKDDPKHPVNFVAEYPIKREMDISNPQLNTDGEPMLAKVLINPGSVGQPRNGIPMAQYAIVEISDTKISVQFRAVEYDLAKVIYQIKEAGLPDYNGIRLLSGR